MVQIAVVVQEVVMLVHEQPVEVPVPLVFGEWRFLFHRLWTILSKRSKLHFVNSSCTSSCHKFTCRILLFFLTWMEEIAGVAQCTPHDVATGEIDLEAREEFGDELWEWERLRRREELGLGPLEIGRSDVKRTDREVHWSLWELCGCSFHRALGGDFDFVVSVCEEEEWLL